MRAEAPGSREPAPDTPLPRPGGPQRHGASGAPAADGQLMENPVLSSYFPADSPRFRCVRFSLTVVAGIGALCLGLGAFAGVVIPGAVRIGVINGTHLGPSSPCLDADPAMCPTKLTFDYFLNGESNRGPPLTPARPHPVPAPAVPRPA